MDRKLDIADGMVYVSFKAAAKGVAAARAQMQANLTLAPADRPPLHGRYRVSTHGKSAQQVADEISALADYHVQKSARIYEGEPLLNTTFTVDGATFTWTDFTLNERGTDCELYVSAGDGNGKPVASMPLRIVRRTVADLPTNEEVIAIVTAAIRAELAASTAQTAKMAEIQTLLGLQ